MFILDVQRVPKRYLLIVVLIPIVAVVVLVALFLSSILSVTPIPNSAVNPPLYPSAGQVKVTEQQYAQDPKAFYYKEIEYDVAAQPEEVQAFYREALLKDGWYRPIGRYHPPAGVAFEWDQEGINGPTDTAFRIGISAVAITGKSTKVTLYILRFNPR